MEWLIGIYLLLIIGYTYFIHIVCKHAEQKGYSYFLFLLLAIFTSPFIAGLISLILPNKYAEYRHD